MKPYSEIIKQQKKALNELIEYAGTKTRLAHYMDVSPQVVQGWVNRGRISATMAIEAEKITNGAITKEYLRPDVLGWFKDAI